MRYLEKIAQLINSFADRVSVYDGKQFKNNEYQGLAEEKGNHFYTYVTGD